MLYTVGDIRLEKLKMRAGWRFRFLKKTKEGHDYYQEGNFRSALQHLSI